MSAKPSALVVAALCLAGIGSVAFAPHPARADAAADNAANAALKRVIPDLNINGVGLSDALDFLKDVSGVKVEADWAALEKAGVKRDAEVTVALKGATFEKALTTILDKAAKKEGALAYTVKNGAIHVAPKK